jgi:hypothetical protein
MILWLDNAVIALRKKVMEMAVLGGLAIGEVYGDFGKRQIFSFRLRLYSGLRQSGSALSRGFYGPTEVGSFRGWWLATRSGG